MIVGIPVYNEEANLARLLSTVAEEAGVTRIIVVDDGSTDRSPSIMREMAEKYPAIEILFTAGRVGPLEAWRIAAGAAGTEIVVFIDGDCVPGAGAVQRIARAVEQGAVVASGRVLPAGGTERHPYARFSADLIHRVRGLGHPKEAVIGRFFAVRADWFLNVVDRTGIIACDALIGCRAAHEGGRVQYVPEAACYFVGATTVADAAAQRQRADAGYAQLRAEGLLWRSDGASTVESLLAVGGAALQDPVGAVVWALGQLRGRFMKAYVPRQQIGSWDTQPSTKRALDP